MGDLYQQLRTIYQPPTCLLFKMKFRIISIAVLLIVTVNAGSQETCVAELKALGELDWENPTKNTLAGACKVLVPLGVDASTCEASLSAEIAKDYDIIANGNYITKGKKYLEANKDKIQAAVAAGKDYYASHKAEIDAEAQAFAEVAKKRPASLKVKD